MSKRSSGGNFGGIGGSGILGLFGTVVNCDADDDSLYCQIMKGFNLLIVFLFVVYILYFLYISFRNMVRGGKKMK